MAITRVLAMLLASLGAGHLAIGAAVSAGQRAGWRRLREENAALALDGSLAALLRARVATTRAFASAPEDGEVAADLAYLDAVLLDEYEVDTTAGLLEALARATNPDARPVGHPAVIGAARARLALARGDARLAAEIANAATPLDRSDPRPLLALARAEAERGDLAAAAHAIEAAEARAPLIRAPLVAWAELALDRGQATDAEAALSEARLGTPQDARTLLLLEEAEHATGRGAHPASKAGGNDGSIAGARAAACARQAELSPTLAARCAVARAVATRLSGDRAQALNETRAAAHVGARDPRSRAQSALLLAELGEIDAAEQQLAPAADQDDPSRGDGLGAWARVAVALGRGAPPPTELPAVSAQPEARLVAARAALAAGGPDALTATMADWDPQAVRADPDLQALSLSTIPDAFEEDRASTTVPDPTRAYAAAVNALATGDVPSAVRWLPYALTGHADACRALGLYLPALALTGRSPELDVTAMRDADRFCLALPDDGASASRHALIDGQGNQDN